MSAIGAETLQKSSRLTKLAAPWTRWWDVEMPEEKCGTRSRSSSQNWWESVPVLTQESEPIRLNTHISLLPHQYDEPIPIWWTRSKLFFSSVDQRSETTKHFGAAESVLKLATRLVAPYKDEFVRCRAIYSWICSHISYDTTEFFSSKRTKKSPEDVLHSKLAICQGYADLFHSMCRIAALESQVVVGLGKGFSFVPGKPLSDKMAHAWNVGSYSLLLNSLIVF